MSSRREEKRTAAEWDPLSALLDAEQEERNNPFAKPLIKSEEELSSSAPVESSVTSTSSSPSSTLSSSPPPLSTLMQSVSTSSTPSVPLTSSTSFTRPVSSASTLTQVSSKNRTTTAAEKEPEEADFEFEEAEKSLVEVRNVAFLSANQDQLMGTLRVTNYRLHFTPCKQMANENRQWFFQDQDIFDLTLGTIDKISRVASNQVVGGRAKDSLMLHITCKDFRKLQFRFASLVDACKIYDVVRMTAFPVSEGQGIKWLFAVEYGKAHLKSRPVPTPGWNVYDPIQEWIRQGLFEHESSTMNSTEWRLTELNMDYQLCPTYPRLLVVPKTFSDSDLEQVAGFRSKGRIPAMTFYNRKNGATIWRCSQPKVGIGNTCRQDELFWFEVLSRSRSNFARIVDCRSFKSAFGNKARGMGYEDELRYEKTNISFLNIHNIHVGRASFEKLFALICSSTSASNSSGGSTPGHNWLSSVEGTGWLNHVRAILNAAVVVARYNACNAFPVLVHCSDGWDRTAQVVSLAQMMVDPFFRTIKGFQVVVEKDWLSFGYKFMERTGHGSDTPSEERSPCFLQFIDCVWQLTNQYPAMFEFNELFLITVMDHLYSCKYGTFLCDSEASRKKEAAVHQKTLSLWDYIDVEKDKFVNPIFVTDAKIRDKPLLPHPSSLTRQVTLWTQYYMRYSSAPSLNQHAFAYLRPDFRHDWPQKSEYLLELLLAEREKVKALETNLLSLTSLSMRDQMPTTHSSADFEKETPE